jgi:Rrf2 family iron-sulfur cluster assembly transcriptional regulator
MIQLADHYHDRHISLQEIATSEQVSEKYLERIFKQLKSAKLITSIKGQGGGYMLTRSPDEIHVSDILVIFEKSFYLVPCLVQSKRKKCKLEAECRTQRVWEGLKDTIQNYLGSMTLSDLMERP